MHKFVLLLPALLLVLGGCTNAGSRNSTDTSLALPSGLDGEELSKIHCARCHQLPQPSALDKAHWEKGVLPQMGFRLGIYGTAQRKQLIGIGEGGYLVEHAGIFPAQPVIAPEDFEKIKAYYTSLAPDRLQLPEWPASSPTGLFKPLAVEERFHPPIGTFVGLFPEKGKFIFADTKGDFSQLVLLDKHFKLIERITVANPVSNVIFIGDTLVATSMGNFMPDDTPGGSIVKMFKKPGATQYTGFTNVLTGLQRPVHSLHVDLDQDGQLDWLVCEYGHHTGSLSWYRHSGTAQYEKQVLLAQPGASKTIVADFNNDGLPDIMALMAQSDEGIDLYTNLGKGRFDRKRVLRFSPLFGSITFHLVDANKDGFKDIIYINGDNADYSVVDKPYHGIRIYLNNGKNAFSEVFFYPLPGAFDARLCDFDHDGDLDIAAISFFPQGNVPERGFIYLERAPDAQKAFHFIPHHLPETAAGRWIRMEVGDLNGDEREDISLLSFTGMGLQNDSTGQFKRWLDTSPSILQLINTGEK